MIKREIILILFLMLNIKSAFSQVKICKIKFNEKNGSEALEKKINNRIISSKSRQEDLFTCYKIGLEHDENKRPIKSSPIYACCKNQ